VGGRIGVSRKILAANTYSIIPDFFTSKEKCFWPCDGATDLQASRFVIRDVMEMEEECGGME